MKRVAVVTGASRGIGRAVAVALARDEVAVACGYRHDEAGAKETVMAVEEAGGTAAAFPADVADEAQVAELFAETERWSGPPLIVVACAGTNRDGLAVRFPAQEFRRIVEVNLTGTFLCVRAALPAMLKARWGRIVSVSSAVALRGNAGQAAYAASKSGVVGLTRTLAREYGGRGITVNAVCPGFIETDMTTALPEAARARLAEEIPAGRTGTPEEAASAIRFLAGEEASYVNGAVVTVDGGLVA